MTFIARTTLQAITDGPFVSQPHAATIIAITKPKLNSARWWIPLSSLTLLTGILAGIVWGGNRLPALPPISFSFSFSLPEPSDVATMFQADREANSGYAETINPPPSDVVVPIPIVSALPPSLEKVAGNTVDTSAGIALPASSLQVPDPAAPDMPKDDATKYVTTDAVNVVAAAITDTPALIEAAKPKIEVKSIDAPIIGHMLEEARIDLDNGDNEGALAIYNRILAHEKGNRTALAGKAFAAQRSGDYETAATSDRHLLTLDPNNEPARINLVAALSAWDAAPALKELQHLVDTRPDFAPAQVALAQRLAGDGKVLTALTHIERAVELDPENVYYKLDLAVTYDKLGHSEEAIDSYQEVLKICEAMDHPAALPVSHAAINARVDYLEKLAASAETIAAQQ